MVKYYLGISGQIGPRVWRLLFRPGAEGEEIYEFGKHLPRINLRIRGWADGNNPTRHDEQFEDLISTFWKISAFDGMQLRQIWWWRTLNKRRVWANLVGGNKKIITPKYLSLARDLQTLAFFFVFLLIKLILIYLYHIFWHCSEIPRPVTNDGCDALLVLVKIEILQIVEFICIINGLRTVGV